MDEELLCGCGPHRLLPQENACPVEGCACTGCHRAGEEMPEPALKAPRRRVVEIGEAGRRSGRGLGALAFLLAAGAMGPLLREEDPPTCLCGGTRGRHRPNCHTFE